MLIAVEHTYKIMTFLNKKLVYFFNEISVVLVDLNHGNAVIHMGEALVRHFASHKEQFSWIIGIVGSSSIALITTAMRSLLVGFLKVILSTMASRDVGPYIRYSDITIMYSVTDVSGMNIISLVEIGNTSNYIAGMVLWSYNISQKQKLVLGMTMFDAMTTCCNTVERE